MKTITFLFITSLFVSTTAFAQAIPEPFPGASNLAPQSTSPQPTTDGQTSLSFSPSVPRPGQQVQVEMRDFSINLNSSLIVWTVDGSEIARGTGVTSTTFTAGDIGERHNVQAAITPQSGSFRSVSGAVTIAGVDIIWTANTLTPTLYKGKALFTPESQVTFAAIPNFSGATGPFVYTWKQGNTVLGSQSGAGKNTLTLTGGLFDRELPVSVEVTTKDKSVRAQKTVIVRPVDVDVVIYEQNPLLGTQLERGLAGTFDLPQDEITLQAVPYYISSPAVNYSWFVNNQNVNTPRDSITLRAEGNVGGISQIDVHLKHISNIFQEARESLIVSFE